MRATVLVLATSLASATLLVDTRPAIACGCLSPPEVTEGDFAVNQQSEQIIFEVEPGWVTAHVLIKYAGDPASFAWIIPVPEVPELGISPAAAFGFLDQLTQPRVNVAVDDVCPDSEWQCKYHPSASCGVRGYGEDSSGSGSGGAPGAGGPPVTVLSEQVIGDYQTVTFRADEANVATAWLRQNGFVVNQTTSIYMEPYVQQGMVFVAAKLVPGAGVKSIKPLSLRYRSAYPMVPLILTAVAAEPHLTVTSYVYSNEIYRPMGHPVVTIDEARIARDTANRVNYPAVLARTIDEAGGDGFVIEYRGAGLTPQFGGPGGCCDDNNTFDRCSIRDDAQCQCPGTALDANDCSDQTDLLDGVQLLKDLAAKHTHLTRITTRVSAEEMTFDPTFEPHFEAPLDGVLQINGLQASLDACSSAVIDKDEMFLADAAQACAATYCGPHGRCVATASGPACLCEPSYVAQRYTDLDGADAVTCVPRMPPVNLRANGEQLPDACAAVSCGTGDTCIDRNGTPVCACAAGKAAVAGPKNPNCEGIIVDTDTPGADDYSDALRDLAVCAPAVPTCGPGGWYVKRTVTNKGVDCGGTQPPVWRTWETPAPSCDNDVFDACMGCDTQSGGSEGAPLMVLAMSSLVGVVVLRRRRREPRTSR